MEKIAYFWLMASCWSISAYAMQDTKMSSSSGVVRERNARDTSGVSLTALQYENKGPGQLMETIPSDLDRWGEFTAQVAYLRLANDAATGTPLKEGVQELHTKDEMGNPMTIRYQVYRNQNFMEPQSLVSGKVVVYTGGIKQRLNEESFDAVLNVLNRAFHAAPSFVIWDYPQGSQFNKRDIVKALKDLVEQVVPEISFPGFLPRSRAQLIL
jgi:hypothetical protein